MHPHPEDSRLTAYVLGELSPEEAAAVEQAAAADPALQTELAEISKIQRTLTTHLPFAPEKLSAEQREHILEQTRPSRIQPFVSLRERLLPWIIPAAAAAVLTLATFILFRMPGETQPALAKRAPTAVIPPPLTQAACAETETRSSIATPRDDTASQPLSLPIQADQPRLAGIQKSIRTDRALPPHPSVHLEEILGSFSFKLSGTTAIARSALATRPADDLETSVPPHLATLATEIIPCPWKPSSVLLLISLRGNPRQDCEVQLAYHPRPQNVAHCQLLGFTNIGPSAILPTKLVAHSATTLALEIQPTTPGADLGTLVWSVDAAAAPAVRLTHLRDAAPSDDARFAALVCTYSEWLAGAQANNIQPETIAALAREITTTTLPTDRADFLRLIAESLQL
jgi:hypothetical protein